MLRALAMFGLLVAMAGAAGAATPSQKCTAAKDKLAGTYMACLQAAEAKGFLKGEDPNLQKCREKFQSAWAKAEEKAAAKGDPCPTEGDQLDVQSAIDELSYALSSLFSGACNGTSVGGFCWFLGASGASCTATCEAAGLVYDEIGTAVYAGSDGTAAQCHEVLVALGATQAASTSDVDCGAGLGCVAAENGLPSHCVDFPTNPGAGETGLLRACACKPGI
jgi:hypothetical protein